ncbi:MAG: response regulator [Candidatus Binataceae bacterium]
MSEKITDEVNEASPIPDDADGLGTREELIRARDSALQSARLRSEFLGNMSHEIRTPLNGIVGMSRLLLDTRLSHEQREMLAIVRQSADTLVKIVTEILDFAKLSAGGVSLEERDFELGAAIESVIALFADQAQHKGVELASYVDAEVPGLLRGDPARLCQLLMSLVGNAVKFTPAGEVTLRVGLVSDAREDVTLRFAVKDSGVGIPLSGQRHLFQAFGRAEAATTRQFGGSGLGLAICAQLVELMDGNIGVESGAGEGALFWFTAKLRKPSAAAMPRGPAGAALDGMRMLVNDQSPTAARLVQEHAHAWGIQCDLAASAAATMVALKTAAATGQPYAVALLEIPDRSPGSLTLARAIKADPALARTRVLGMYALGAHPDERRTRAAGIRAVLAKPIKQTQLFNLLSIIRQTVGETAALRSDQDPARRRRGRAIASHLPPEVRARTRILLVEDSPVNQRVQMRILERIGFAADTVNNGQEALAALEQHPYDIILMDCQMPGLDGYNATREIRRREANGRRTVIIGVTANALSGDREECLAIGMDDYVAKPVAPEDLAATLEKWVTPAVTP